MTTTTYRNPWHTPGKIEYGPAHYTTDAKPTDYRGYSIFGHRYLARFDVVKDGTCIGQYAGLSGAKGLVDLIHDNPSDWWAQRALSYLQTAEEDHKPACRTRGCTNDPDSGEGYDGYCGSCADRMADEEEA